MGASQPKQQNQINLNLIINGQSFNLNQDVNSAAPAPILGLQAIANAKDSEGKDIPVNLNVKNNSINSSDNSTSDNTKQEISSTIGKNIDNNIGQNVLNNSEYSLFNNNNLDNSNYITNTDEKNKSENNNNNNNEINNHEKPHQNYNNNYENNNNNEIKNNNEINNCNKSDSKENNNNDNNFMKEGVQQRTKFGEEEESKEKKPETNRGNEIDINIGKKENFLNNQGNTDNGKQDINYGSGFANGKKDKYIGNNYSENDFEISKIELNPSEEKTLEESQELLDKGLFPLFIKIKDFNPKFFLADRHSTLKIMLKAYFDNTPGIDTNIFNNIKLYLGKRPLDINEEIQYLKLKQYSVIKDIETERRLFYVALTRAKDNLYILFTKKRNGKSYRPSRFILEGVEEGKNGRKEKSTSC